MSEWTQFSHRDTRIPAECRSWSPDDDERLRSLWGTELSAAQIGLRIGRSKNSIVGRAHRLALPARPSPIVPTGTKKGPRRRVPYNRGPVTLPLLSALDELKEMATFARKTPPPPATEEPTTFKPLPSVPCCFPTNDGWHKGRRQWLFCEDPSEPGKPYCSYHMGITHVRIRDRREDAQAAA